MSSPASEAAFETAIVAHLTNGGGYSAGDAAAYSHELAFFPAAVLDFVQSTQPQKWEQLAAIHGESVALKFQQRLFKELDNRGMLDVLRHGIVDYGVRFRLAFFKPASGLNPETLALYNQNRLTVTRQVYYSLKNNNSVDLLLALNGLPVATVELKNQFTGQDASDARQQYRPRPRPQRAALSIQEARPGAFRRRRRRGLDDHPSRRHAHPLSAFQSGVRKGGGQSSQS